MRDGITYICKDPIIKSYLIDYNYSPPQKYELNQITAKIQGNRVIVGTDCYTTHIIKSGTFWKIENREIAVHFLRQIWQSWKQT